MCSLLIQPIQRIPRYRLLFEELLKRTPNEHPDYEPLSKTLASIQEVKDFNRLMYFEELSYSLVL